MVIAKCMNMMCELFFFFFYQYKTSIIQKRNSNEYTGSG